MSFKWTVELRPPARIISSLMLEETVNLTLQDVKIEFDDGADTGDICGTAALTVTGNTEATAEDAYTALSLTLQGKNVLTGGLQRAGLNVPNKAKLEITAKSTGSLAARSKSRGAGIGGNRFEDIGYGDDSSSTGASFFGSGWVGNFAHFCVKNPPNPRGCVRFFPYCGGNSLHQSIHRIYAVLT